MPDPKAPKQKAPATDSGPGRQVDDNIDDLGRSVTDGEVEKERHPQLDKTGSDTPRRKDGR